MSLDRLPNLIRLIVTKAEFESFVSVDKDTGCWIWAYGKGGAGYGEFYIIGKQHYAHRISYILYNGDITDGLFVLHKCDIKLCVNPNHLYLGTHSDNMRDLSLRGPRRVNKEICRYGHPLTEDNLVIRKRDKSNRECLTCMRDRQRERRAKARAKIS